ncbi:MAG: helix-turn-helix transcriptional regulator [Nitrospira sp.]
MADPEFQGLTLSELARRMKILQSTISAIETDFIDWMSSGPHPRRVSCRPTSQCWYFPAGP